jgi:ribosomal protein S18 acetylase RimI-like enzyme
MAAAITYRLAREDDLRRTYDLMLEAEGDLARSRQMSLEELTIPDERRALAARAASLQDFPGLFWVAVSDGAVVGFAIAYLRGTHWHLKSLQVVPAYQGRGIGAELMRRCMVGLPPRSVRSVVSEAIQPVSNSLYLRAGMYPRLVVYPLSGDPRAARRRAVGPGGVGAAASDVELDALDRQVLGYARPDAHRLWRDVIDADRVVSTRSDGGRIVGYAYIATDGTIGPALGRTPLDLRTVIAHSMARLAETDARSATVHVVGTVRPVIDGLLRAGFRIGPVPLFFMASSPSPGFRLQAFSPDGVL